MHDISTFDHRMPEPLRILLVGPGVWFVPDTLISAYFSAYFNVVINTVILIADLIPLVAGEKALKRTSEPMQLTGYQNSILGRFSTSSSNWR